MTTPPFIARNQATLKLLFIGALSLGMLIPLLMVRSIIHERQSMQQTASQTIASRWGGPQVVGGLVAMTPATIVENHERGTRSRASWQAHVLTDLAIDAQLSTEMRQLGIYQVPVYTTVVTVSGSLDAAQLARWQPDGEVIFWLPLGDVRGVREVSALTLEGGAVGRAGTGRITVDARPLNAAFKPYEGLQFTLPQAQRDQLLDHGSAAPTIRYQLQLTLAGSSSLLFLPLAATTEVKLEADWPHPEFIGQVLPLQQSIGAEGTGASWRLLGLNRRFGDEWEPAELETWQLHQSGFGMRLETPVDAYQRNERSVKYGFLFIALTFITLFLFEILTARPLHPVPYLLTGAALCVFYLVLLALSEYLLFAPAFALAAGALVTIITAYTGAVLGGRRRGLWVGLMMTLTYALLYVLVSAEHTALLLGSVTLLTVIAVLMYLTRNVDWYGYGSRPGR